eukprot:10398749-Prorocentrum_lima.AAC.1
MWRRRRGNERRRNRPRPLPSKWTCRPNTFWPEFVWPLLAHSLYRWIRDTAPNRLRPRPFC